MSKFSKFGHSPSTISPDSVSTQAAPQP